MSSISKSTSVISILRALSVPNKHLSDKQWLRSHCLEVRAIGSILRFLRLAKPDSGSVVGWEPNSAFFEIVYKGKRQNPAAQAFPQAGDSNALIDMLHGIASGVVTEDDRELLNDPGEYRWDGTILGCTSGVLEAIGLLRAGNDRRLKPTPLLCELFFEAALEIRQAARSEGECDDVGRSRFEYVLDDA
jgi:hypothetical protein